MSNIEKYSQKIFEEIKHYTEDGMEFWYARELQMVLDHFADARSMVQLGSGVQREVDDIILSRYACYLIVQNSDPRKEVIALGQTYFAVKTREREIEEEFNELSEEQKRKELKD